MSRLAGNKSSLELSGSDLSWQMFTLRWHVRVFITLRTFARLFYDWKLLLVFEARKCHRIGYWCLLSNRSRYLLPYVRTTQHEHVSELPKLNEKRSRKQMNETSLRVCVRFYFHIQTERPSQLWFAKHQRTATTTTSNLMWISFYYWTCRPATVWVCVCAMDSSAFRLRAKQI